MSSIRTSIYYDAKCRIYSKKYNSLKVVKEGCEKMVAQFRIGVVPYFGEVT
jgi:hypothetical protein